MNNTYTNDEEICPACNGAKIQINKDCLKVLCPVCGGRGKLRIYDQPYYKSHTYTQDNINYQTCQ